MTNAQVDLQNAFIKERLAKVNLAVNTLAALGLTVCSVNIEATSPQIKVRTGRACEQLESAITRYYSDGGSRRTERVAFVADCQVRWEEYA
ncbi:hypothetical protein Q4508_12455 [Amphritea sp. 2_MG-2023]|uniref:hypothetical protein n=1 Tax=Amphritea TaxID=515417 RepID=UPI001C072E8A|nr:MULTISPECIES: hypothetical protein [Amphritea]MBU2967084.1 hypothetical protein [Amphritea atlantica]MDO6419363.1 hypothetical protein [Amphritea sp. 2_MG-2023]